MVSKEIFAPGTKIKWESCDRNFNSSHGKGIVERYIPAKDPFSDLNKYLVKPTCFCNAKTCKCRSEFNAECFSEIEIDSISIELDF